MYVKLQSRGELGISVSVILTYIKKRKKGLHLIKSEAPFYEISS